jgi:hypothetical protein
MPVKPKFVVVAFRSALTFVKQLAKNINLSLTQRWESLRFLDWVIISELHNFIPPIALMLKTNHLILFQFFQYSPQLEHEKTWCLYTIEFYSAMKKNEIMLFAGKRMELENIILIEVSQTWKDKSCMFSLIYKYI